MDLSLFWALLIISGVIFWGFIYGSHRRGNAKGQTKILYVVGSVLTCATAALLFTMVAKQDFPMDAAMVSMVGFLIPPVSTFFILDNALEWEAKLNEADKTEALRVATLSSAAQAEEAAIRVRNAEAKQLRESARQFGAKSKTLICPHCQTKGSVRKTDATRVTKNRVNSVAGRAIGLGTNSEQKVTQLHCDNCDVTWDVK